MHARNSFRFAIPAEAPRGISARTVGNRRREYRKWIRSVRFTPGGSQKKRWADLTHLAHFADLADFGDFGDFAHLAEGVPT